MSEPTRNPKGTVTNRCEHPSRDWDPAYVCTVCTRIVSLDYMDAAEALLDESLNGSRTWGQLVAVAEAFRAVIKSEKKPSAPKV